MTPQQFMPQPETMGLSTVEDLVCAGGGALQTQPQRMSECSLLQLAA
jgi:hypothetical protein